MYLLTLDAVGLNDAGKRIIIKTMKNHIGNNEIQIISAKIFSHLIVSGKHLNVLSSLGSFLLKYCRSTFNCSIVAK